MAEYICREEAIEAIRQTYCPNCDSCNGLMCKACGYKDCMDIVDDVPAADVQPVKRGKWECEHYDELIECYVANCSECGYESTDNYRITPNHRYCEYCGTRMIKDGVFE